MSYCLFKKAESTGEFIATLWHYIIQPKECMPILWVFINSPLRKATLGLPLQVRETAGCEVSRFSFRVAWYNSATVKDFWYWNSSHNFWPSAFKIIWCHLMSIIVISWPSLLRDEMLWSSNIALCPKTFAWILNMKAKSE